VRCDLLLLLSENDPSFAPGSLLDDLVVAEDARADDGMAGDTVEQLSAIADLSSPGWQVTHWGTPASRCATLHSVLTLRTGLAG